MYQSFKNYCTDYFYTIIILYCIYIVYHTQIFVTIVAFLCILKYQNYCQLNFFNIEKKVLYPFPFLHPIYCYRDKQTYSHPLNFLKHSYRQVMNISIYTVSKKERSHGVNRLNQQKNLLIGHRRVQLKDQIWNFCNVPCHVVWTCPGIRK